jgi:hypothetical protein
VARLEDLNLKPPPVPSRDDIEGADAFAAECESLLDNERYSFAWDTISGMRDTARTYSKVTPKMYIALRNIRAGVERATNANRRWGRRYEGR